MSDQRTRELERRSQDDPEARGLLLVARERAGHLSGIPCPEASRDPLRHVFGDGRSLDCEICGGKGFMPYRAGIELAAYLGDEAARRAAGKERRSPTPHPDMGWIVSSDGPWWKVPDAWCQSDWVRGLGRDQVLVRAAIAAARVALDHYGNYLEDTCGDPACMPNAGEWCDLHGMNLVAMEAAEGWALCACEDHSAEDHAAICRSAASDFLSDTPGWLVWMCLGIYHLTDGHEGRDMLERAILSAATFLTPETPAPSSAVLSETWLETQREARREVELGLRMEIKSEIVPWALGERDPVAERHK